MKTKEELIELALHNGIKVDWVCPDVDESNKNIERDSYDLCDCMLVRTTDIFPTDKVVQTPEHGNACVYGTSEIFGEAILSKIRAKYPKVMSEEEEKRFSFELSQYDILFDIPRSTVHFTINGLVGSHLYGNFENNPYIILDPLEEHIDEESLVGLRVEDTYFKDDIDLSSRSTIMMPKESFEKAINNFEYIETLKRFNVVVFEGDERLAVEHVLHNLGYNAFTVNNHGYVDSFSAEGVEETKMITTVRKIANERGIPQDRHCYSEVYLSDFNKRVKKDEQNNKNYLFYVLDNSDAPDELKDRLRSLADLCDSYQMRNNPLVRQFVDTVGLDQFRIITAGYNQQYVANINMKKQSDNKTMK